ncbi:MAG TPA: hypothetical protein VKR58_09650 [Aquella sp.]|nr:hypothetical protein [Aquella sp.]
MFRKKIIKKAHFSDRLLNNKLPYAIHDYIGEQLNIKKNEKISMMKHYLFVALILSVVIFSIILLCSCTALDPIGDKNVEYVFENVSYDSPNSNPHDNIGEMKGKFNFDKKLPIR